MDPRYRFTIVISLLLIIWWLWVVISTYLFGDTGLNTLRYQRGIILVALAATGGFISVWLAYRLILWHRQAKTGFEAEPTDEFGTAYLMTNSSGNAEPYRIALSKFQPALLAPPLAEPGLHPLEAELIGFLQGYRHWPLDLHHPETSLYEQAMARWHTVKALPSCTPWLRAAALAQDLAMVQAYEEQRTSAPWWQPFTRDTIRFKHKTEPRPGMSALLLSTMPAFRALSATPEGAATGRALLAATRYYATPHLLPLNAGALAAQIIEGLQRAELGMGQIDASTLDTLSPARQEALAAALPKIWLGVLGTQTPTDKINPSTTLYLGGGGTPTAWLNLTALLNSLGPQLDPSLRTILQLWEPLTPDTPANQHPAWGHILPLLEQAEMILPQHLGIQALAGTFTLEGHATEGQPAVAWGPAVKINVAHPLLNSLVSSWGTHSKGPAAELALEPAMLRKRATLHLQQLDAQLRDLF
jgi:hypothetical protein